MKDHFGVGSSMTRVFNDVLYHALKIAMLSRKWKDLPCSWVGRINTVKMAILPKAIYRFTAMPSKISVKFFTDLKRTIFNFIWKKNPG